MTRRGLLSALLIGLLTATSPAGVFNSAEPLVQPATSFDQFHQQLIAIRRIANEEVELPQRTRALLVAKMTNAPLTPQERQNVGAYLLALGKFAEAAETLKSVTAQERRNFLLLSTAATAEFLDGQQRGDRDQMRLAREKLGDAL